MRGRRPTRADVGARDNAPPDIIRFGHAGITHYRIAQFNPKYVYTLCAMQVTGSDKQLRMKATYDPPADAEVCQACLAERDRRLANYAKMMARRAAAKREV